MAKPRIGNSEIEVFKEYFKEYEDNYVLIGGSASYLILDNAGIDFRATKDLDLVLCIEALSKEFIYHFWNFIKLGGYSIAQKSGGKKCFYRFEYPKELGYPYMLEILSDQADIFEGRQGQTILPMSIEDEIVSLSAIILNKDYYEFIMSL